MKHRAERQRYREDLNRGDYRQDFGPEGAHRFSYPDEQDRDREDRTVPRPGRGRAGFLRGRTSGGYGSQFDAWSSGAGYTPRQYGQRPDPEQGWTRDEDWQPTRPARGPGAWAGDWAGEDHRGRGPKGYRRSDERLRDDVCERLTEDWSVDATDISVDVADGEVTLSGTVPSREQKRRAEECAERVSGVHDVFNRLRVSPRNEAAADASRGVRQR